MVDNVFKGAGYVISASIDAATAAKNYVISGGGNNSPATKSYIITAEPAATLATKGYVITTGGTQESGVLNSKRYIITRPFYPPYEDIVTEFSFIERGLGTGTTIDGIKSSGYNTVLDYISYGSTGGPGFKTSIVEMDSGFTSTTIDWDLMRARYTMTLDHIPPADSEIVEDLFYACRGRSVGFRYKDWSDYTITNQNFFVGDGVNKTFQIFKRYSSGGYIFDRIIRKPISSTFVVSLNGTTQTLNTDYFVNDTTGEMTFITAPPVNSLGTIVQAEFDVPVRFDTDLLDVSFDDFRQLNISSIPLIEIIP